MKRTRSIISLSALFITLIALVPASAAPTGAVELAASTQLAPRVTYPSDGGITWTRGKPYTIRWTGYPGSTVRILLYKGSAVVSTIVSSTANDGALVWTVPASVPTGPGYSIKITSLADTSKADYSDKRFSITTASGPKEKTFLLPGNLPITMVRIPAGSFRMGSPATERGRASDESPLRTVRIGYSFYIAKYEITQQQWKAVMGSNPMTNSLFGVGDNYPATNVLWEECQNFAKALSAHIAATHQGSATFRLPSESEWEYACRAGMQTRYYFGDSTLTSDTLDGPAGRLPGNRSDYAWYPFDRATYRYGSHPVGLKLPNQFGLYDVSGNAAEWCQDYWHTDYKNAPVDGTAYDTSPELDSNRIIRGGSWNVLDSCRSAARSQARPTIRFVDIGVRFVCAE